MKKILYLLLLLPGFLLAQVSTGQEQEFDYGIKNNASQTVPNSTYLVTEGSDGTYGKMLISNIPTTTAGLSSRIWWTGDNTTVTAGTFFSSSITGKGTVTTASPTQLSLNDNTKAFFNKDVISIAQPSNTIGYQGSYSGNLTVSADPTPGVSRQRFTVEIYRTNNGGTPIASGVPGAPTGDLGVTVVAILDSGEVNLVAGSISNVPVTGILTQQITLLTGERLRYHVSAAKIGTDGGNVEFNVFYGSNHNSYYDIPVAIKASGVIADTGASLGTTVAQALDNLSILKEDKANKSDGYTVSSSTTYTSTKALVDGLILKAGLFTTNSYTGFNSFSNSNGLRITSTSQLENNSRLNLMSDGFQSFIGTRWNGTRRFAFENSNNITNENFTLRLYSSDGLSAKSVFSSDFNPSGVMDLRLVPSGGLVTVSGKIVALAGASANEVVIKSQLDLKADQSTTYTKTEVLDGFVGVNNVQTVNQTKTFTSSPVVPDGTISSHAVNKGQLDLKANSNNPTFTGTVSGITKSMVGLGNVDNTSDVNKPISTATQTALDLKANLAGNQTFTGVHNFPTAALGTNTGQAATTKFVLDNSIDLTSPQTVTGRKSFSGITSTTGGIYLGSVTGGSAIDISTVTVGNKAINIRDLGNDAVAVKIENGNASFNTPSRGVVVNGLGTANSAAFVGQDNGVNTFTVDKTGIVSLYKINTATGSNASAGNATLVGGIVTVTTSAATSSSLILLTHKTSGGTLGVADYTTTNGSFTITSNNVLDTSTYTYLIIN